MIDRLVKNQVNYWFGFGLDVALSLAGIGLAFATHGPSVATFATLTAGVLAYTFIEYAIHRWIYHGPRSPMNEVHTGHHDDANVMVGAPFFAPPVLSTINFLAAWLVIPAPLAAAFSATILISYECQGLIHAISHAWPGTRSLRSGGFFRAMRRHHMIHHHTGGDVNFGFTTALWDRVFGTYSTHAKRSVDVARPRVAKAPVSVEAPTPDATWAPLDFATSSDRSSSAMIGT